MKSIQEYGNYSLSLSLSLSLSHTHTHTHTIKTHCTFQHKTYTALRTYLKLRAVFMTCAISMEATPLRLHFVVQAATSIVRHPRGEVFRTVQLQVRCALCM